MGEFYAGGVRAGLISVSLISNTNKMEDADLMNNISGMEKFFACNLMMNAISVKLLVASNIQSVENMISQSGINFH